MCVCVCVCDCSVQSAVGYRVCAVRLFQQGLLQRASDHASNAEHAWVLPYAVPFLDRQMNGALMPSAAHFMHVGLQHGVGF